MALSGHGPSYVGVIGEISTTVSTMFLAELSDEAERGGKLPSAARTVDGPRSVIGSGVFNNPIFNVFADNMQVGGVVTNQPRNEFNFGDIQGNVAAGSSNFSQVYNDIFDVAKVQDFVDLIAEIAGALELEPQHRAELEAGAQELRAAVDDPAADKGRMRRAVDAVMRPLSLAGQTALRTAAIALGTQVGTELDAAIRHLPHP